MADRGGEPCARSCDLFVGKSDRRAQTNENERQLAKESHAPDKYSLFLPATRSRIQIGICTRWVGENYRIYLFLRSARPSPYQLFGGDSLENLVLRDNGFLDKLVDLFFENVDGAA
jgi:hypothetical protein